MASVTRIVVAHASTGSKHRLAAEAVAREIGVAGADRVRIDVVDALGHAPVPVADLTDGRLTGSPLGRGALRALTPLLALSARRLVELLLVSQPAVIVSSHPLPTALAARLAARDRLRSRVISVATDFSLPGAVPAAGIAMYCVSHDGCADALIERGVPADTVRVTGIPVRPQFTVEYDTAAARAHFELPAEGRVVVAVGGASTHGRHETLQEALAISLPALASLPNTALVIVTGHDTRFAALMSSRSAGFGTTNVHVLDYVEHMAPLIACADLVIAKPNGLLSAECVDSGVPLVLVGPAHGSERTNARTLSNAGAARYAEDPRTLADHVRTVLSDPRRLARMREAASALARPFAAADVARHALDLACVEPPAASPRKD